MAGIAALPLVPLALRQGEAEPKFIKGEWRQWEGVRFVESKPVDLGRLDAQFIRAYNAKIEQTFCQMVDQCKPPVRRA